MVRTERQSDSRKRERKWQTCWCCRDQQRACRMAQASAKKLEHTGPAEKERVGLSATERADGKNAGTALAKRKRNRAVCPKHQIMKGEKVKVGESRTLARERGLRAEAWRGKGGLQGERRQIPRRKGRARKKSLPRTSRRKHERVSGRKSSPGQPAQSWFYLTSGQTEIEREVGRQRTRSLEKRVK